MNKPIWFVDKRGYIFNLAEYLRFSIGTGGRTYGHTGRVEIRVDATLDEIAYAIDRSLAVGEYLYSVYEKEGGDE